MSHEESSKNTNYNIYFNENFTTVVYAIHCCQVEDLNASRKGAFVFVAHEK